MEQITTKEIILTILICACIGITSYNVNRLVTISTTSEIPSYLIVDNKPQNSDNDPLIVYNPMMFPKNYPHDLMFDMGPMLASSESSEGTKKRMDVQFRSLNAYNIDLDLYKKILEQNNWTISSNESSTSTTISAKKGIESATIMLVPDETHQNITNITVHYEK